MDMTVEKIRYCLEFFEMFLAAAARKDKQRIYGKNTYLLYGQHYRRSQYYYKYIFHKGVFNTSA